MDNLEEYLADQLNTRRQKGILRNLRLPVSGLIDFTSNDYLGLARSMELQSKIKDALNGLPIRNGATGARLLSGNSVLHEELESTLSRLFKSESCLVFNSGYTANLGVLSAIPSRNDTILYDELCHSSIKDGIRLSVATRHSFKHNDLEDLEQKIKRAHGKIFIAIESIYSMDGDICPLKQLVELSERYGCIVVLDEAHSTGLMGEGGAGLAVALNLHSRISIRIYTFGKAIGSHGACVAGSQTLIHYLINFSRPFIYATALPDHNIVALMEAFRFIQSKPNLQKQLESKIELFATLMRTKSNSSTAIQTIIIGSVALTKEKSIQLSTRGFDVRPIYSPTVPIGTERLRICLHTFNTDEEIITLTQALNS